MQFFYSYYSAIEDISQCRRDYGSECSSYIEAFILPEDGGLSSYVETTLSDYCGE